MAEIEIERRPRRSGWTWFALLLVLAAVAIGAWLVFGNGIEGGDAPPAAEINIETPATEPATQRAPEPATEPATTPGDAPGGVPEDAGAGEPIGAV